MKRLLLISSCMLCLLSTHGWGQIDPEVDINKEITNTMDEPAWDVKVELWGDWEILPGDICLGTSSPDLSFASADVLRTYPPDGGVITIIHWQNFYDPAHGDSTIDPGQTIHIGWRGQLVPGTIPPVYVPILSDPIDPYINLPGVKTCYWTDHEHQPMEDAYIPNTIAAKGPDEGIYKIYFRNPFEGSGSGLPMTVSDLREAIYSSRLPLNDLNAGNISLAGDLDVNPDILGGTPMELLFFDDEVVVNPYALLGGEYIVLRYNVTSPGTAANVVDYVQFQVRPPGPGFEIPKLEDIPSGHFTDISIFARNSYYDFGGFDFLIGYDARALSFSEAAPGQLLDDCDWEYFTYRHGATGNCGSACPSGMLRLVALAETTNGPFHPACYKAPDTDLHQIAKLTFYVTNDRTFNCQFVPVYFFWDDCTDNSVASIDGEYLYIDHAIYDFERNLIWHEEADGQFPEDSRIDFVGAPDYCLNPNPDKPSAIRLIDFVNGGIDIICSDSIDLRGDINCNGIPNEIADAVMLANYFMEGVSAFDDHIEASIAASDVNADGIVLSIADLVYMIRVMIGDAPAYPKVAPFANKVSVSTLVNHSAFGVSTTSEVSIGAGYFVFEHSGVEIGQPHLINGASDMTLLSRDCDGVLKILVYSMEPGTKIPAGTESIFAVPISGEGRIRLIESQLSDYDGNLLEAVIEKLSILPKAFALHQNYPNPFNAATTLIYELPEASHVRIEVFNILGQKVATLVDQEDDAGVHSVQWDSTDDAGRVVSSGVYFYRITTPDFSDEKKMVLMK